MNRSEILNTARDYVTRDRAATHGRAEDQFATIGARWSILLGVEVTPVKVALMMADLKLARAWTNPAHADNFVDLAGYAACGGEIATSTKLPNEGLSFAAHMARRDAEREAVKASEAPAIMHCMNCQNGADTIHDFVVCLKGSKWEKQKPWYCCSSWEPRKSGCDAERAQWHKSAEAAGLPERSCDCAVKAGTCHCPGNWTTDPKTEEVLAEIQRLGQEFDTDPQPLEWPDDPPVAPSEWGKPVGSELKIYPLRAEIGPGGATLTKRQCDCGETAGECFCPSEWPAAPIGSPPDGLGDASATHAAKSAEGPSSARVCGECMWVSIAGPLGVICQNAQSGNRRVGLFTSCVYWEPRIAARDATAWTAQDGGVE